MFGYKKLIALELIALDQKGHAFFRLHYFFRPSFQKRQTLMGYILFIASCL
jgi:hypothetical protein